MKLLFITRKIDRQDTRTGFVFDWIIELAKKLDRLYIICQEQGDLQGLPFNVEVHSFGKDKGYGRLRQFFSFQFLLFRLAGKSDGIFAHMMPIYVILSWLPAEIFGTKIVFWYTHKSVDKKLHFAHWITDRVLTASEESFRLSSDKVEVVGHGIPINRFDLSDSTKNTKTKIEIFRIVSVGRISRVKDYETLIKAVEILVNDRGMKNVQVKIYGDPASEEDLSYQQSLREFVNKAGLEHVVYFEGGVEYEKVPSIYHTADLFVNLSKTGSIDKTVLEAAISGIFVMSSNEAFQKDLSEISDDLYFQRDNPIDLADKIERLRKIDARKRARIISDLKAWVRQSHDLENLIEKIIREYR